MVIWIRPRSDPDPPKLTGHEDQPHDCLGNHMFTCKSLNNSTKISLQKKFRD